MSLSSVLGFPRMGANRELKKAAESFFAGKISEAALLEQARALRQAHWQLQRAQGVDLVASNDHSLFDHVLDHSLLFNIVPRRYINLRGNGGKEGAGAQGLSDVELLFAMGRGLQRPASGAAPAIDVPSQEMVKWFDSNYHFFRPEFRPDTHFTLPAAGRLVKPVEEFLEAKALGIVTRPVLLGPVSLLHLGKVEKDENGGGGDKEFSRYSLLPKLLPVYAELLRQLKEAGAQSVQIDEPVLVFDLPAEVTALFKPAYESLARDAPGLPLQLTTYYGSIVHNLETIVDLPIAALHIDVVRAPEQLAPVLAALAPTQQKLSLGVVDGRNIWKTNLQGAIATVQDAVRALGGDANRVLVSSSSSLLHIPHTLESERDLTAEVKDFFSFAKEKCAELAVITRAVREGAQSIQKELTANARSITARCESALSRNEEVRKRQAAVTPAQHERASPFAVRRPLQQAHLRLPSFPTTTIGSFPQTSSIRKAREAHVKGQLSKEQYDKFIEEEIRTVVEFQEACGLDVLVHGEPERNDMVQYFLEQMNGCAFTTHAWVQSYGTRCVRPPIIVGDVSRRQQMSVKESVFAASLTKKPMKGMLTGPVTCLRWSFPRVDLPLSAQAQQLALAIRDEVADLETVAGLAVIQIDEPALREGLPLRAGDHAAYLDWAVQSFKLATCPVRDSTQIHSHFCYSDFNEIFAALAALDADVITIEASKSDLKLLHAIEQRGYEADIGPGVWDIHSPRVPSLDEMVSRIRSMLTQGVRADQLWINPDCGLKTRGWEEVKATLTNMVQAAKIAREEKQNKQ